MVRLMAWALGPLADAVLRARLADVGRSLDEANHRAKLLQIERDGLAEVVARDRQRVLAETAELGTRIAKAGG